MLTSAAPELVVGNNLPHSLLEHVVTDTRILSTSVLSLLTMNSATTLANGHTEWASSSVRAGILRKTEHLLAPLCCDNNHWVALRTSQQYNMVELFVFLQTEQERERALVYARQLAAYLIAVGHLRPEPRYMVHTSPEWQQYDGSSCGLLTLGVLLSLLRGLRVSLDCSASHGRARDWRAYFAKMVVDAIRTHTDRGPSEVDSSGDGVAAVDLTGDDD